MNCLIYLRVSTEEQAKKGLNEEGYSIPAQREACLKYIKEREWNFIDEFADRGASAKNIHRPQLQEMIDYIKENKNIDVVVVHKIDRLARNLEDHVAIKSILKRLKVRLVSVVENIEDTASGRLIEGIHAVMAEFYSANLGAEAKKGMLQKAKQGWWPQMAPIGYKNVTKVQDGRVIKTIAIDEERAHFIKKAFELYATGEYSTRTLTETLKDMGLKTRASKRWPSQHLSLANLCKVLQNKFYTGKFEWNGVEFVGKHKPIISQELFDRVQEIIRMNDVSSIRQRKYNHYLKGTLYCGECGARMSVDQARGHLYYYCLGHKRRNGCKQKYIEVGKIEELIENLYLNIQLPEGFAQKLQQKLESQLIERNKKGISERQYITNKIQQLENEKMKILQAFYSNAIDIDLLKKEQDRISKETTILENKLEVSEIKNESCSKVIDAAIMMASNCHRAYKRAKPQIKRKLNRAFFNKLYIKDNELTKNEFSEVFDPFFNPCSKKSVLAPRVGLEPTT